MTNHITITVPLTVDQKLHKILKSRFNVSQNFYNAVLREGLKRYRIYQKLKSFKYKDKIVDYYDKKKSHHKFTTEEKNNWKTMWVDIERESGYYNLSSNFKNHHNSLGQFGSKTVRKSFIKQHTVANECNQLSTRAFRAIENMRKNQQRNFKKGKLNKAKVRFYGKKHPLTCITDGGSSSGFKLMKNGVQWTKTPKDIFLPIQFIDNDPYHEYLQRCWQYEQQIIQQQGSLTSENKILGETKLIRRQKKGQWKYFIQILCKGNIPQKNRQYGKGAVGIDIGLSTFACVSLDHAVLDGFCNQLENKQKEIKRIQRKIDRQRRANNPECYDERGRNIKGKFPNKKSRRQKLTEIKLSDLKQKEATLRKCLHGQIVNQVRAMGDHLYIEDLSYKSWQQNKYWSKTMQKLAPGMFVQLLTQRFVMTNGIVEKINTHKTKLHFIEPIPCQLFILDFYNLDKYFTLI